MAPPPAPVSSERGAWVTEAESSEYLITYAWRTDYHRNARGEDWAIQTILQGQEQLLTGDDDTPAVQRDQRTREQSRH